MKKIVSYARCSMRIFLLGILSLTMIGAYSMSDLEFDPIVVSIVDDVYRKAASDCTVASLAADVQNVLNKLNIIGPQVTNIQQIVTIILQRIGNLSVNDQIIISQLDLIESLIANINLSVSGTLCCSVLEDLISQDDALILSKLDEISNQITNLNISVLPCTVSGLDELELLVSIGDAVILSAIDRTNCCSVLENLVSADDAYLATKIDTVLSQLSIVEKDIFSKIDAASCCSVLENLISHDDAYLATKIDNLSLQTSIGDAVILSAFDRANCCSILENLISKDDAYLATKIDNLSLQISIGDTAILSAIASLSAGTSPCSATPITASTTITTSGFYCLANNSVSLIVINANDVVVDLNNHVVIGAVTVNATNDVTIGNGVVRSPSTATDAIAVNGTSNIKLSHVRAENGQRGIYMNGVQSGAVSNCEFTSNFTGIELVASADVTVEKSAARRNQYSGFSLASSFTNTIRDCTAMNSGQGNTNQINNNVYGFVAFNSTNNIFENCIANATQALSTTDYNSIVAGFALTGTSNCNKIIGCEAANAITNANGVTVPYGIYLQGTIGSQYTLTAVPLVPISVGQGVREYASWSSDGQYFAVPTGDTTARLNVYAFNRATEIFTRVAIPDILPTSDVQVVAWSPGDYFLAAGSAVLGATDKKLRVYLFDRSNNSLQQVALPDIAPTNGVVDLSWRYDQQFLAIGGGGSPHLMIYAFDPVALQLSLVASNVTITTQVNAVDWSPDGLYLAVGISADPNNFLIFRFDSTTNSLTQVAASNPVIGNAVNSAQWSHDGAYVAIGTNVSEANRVQIYSFNRTTNQLTRVATPTINPVGTINEVTWSPDDRYVFAGGDTSPFIYLYQFDRGANALTLIATPDSGPKNNISSVTWSPDGRFITATSTIPGNALGTYVYSALSFPSDNVIKDNTVYCNSGAQYPSGVGISGSSICNYIVGNTAYSNPVNPLIVSSNYQFVCNVFNQLFGNAPSLLQNIALGSCEPIAIPDNTALLIKQTKALLSSQIDLLSLQMSIGDTAILSAIASLSAGTSPCSATPITASTTITTSGFYCLANNSVQNITISASDVVVDLNNHVVIGAVTVNATNDVTIGNGVVRSLSTTSDAIAVNGTSNIRLSHVRAENGQRGIYMNGVQSGAVSNCEFTSNFTGIELVASADVTVEKSAARRNQYSGFSLASSFTNTIRDCTAMNSGQGNTNQINNNVYGFVAFNSTNNIFENCIANATQALSTTDYNSIVAGFALTGTSNCNKIIGCEAANAITNASGVTVPYGIYLQDTFSGLISLTVAAPGAPNDPVAALSWSPDGQYLVVGLDSYSLTSALNLYRYNRTTDGLVLLQSINLNLVRDDTALGLQWSPDGNYLGVSGDVGTTIGTTNANGVIIYQFNRTIEQLTQVASVDPFGAGVDDHMFTFAWSPDGQYFAVGGQMDISAHSGVFVYGFNVITQSISLLTTIVPPGGADVIRTVQWSPDGNYLAFGGSIFGADDLFVYSFNRGTGTFAFVVSASASGGIYNTFETLAWSPDGNYLAVGGGSGSLPSPTPGPLVVYRFNRGNSPGLVSMDTSSLIANVESVAWSPDGRFLSVYGNPTSLFTGATLNVFTFDRGTQKLGFLQSLVLASSNNLSLGEVAWSPDGRLLAVGGQHFPGNFNLIIYQALSFPSDNVIKDNTVYCNSGAQYPSGVGISGSSICNMIIQNTAYSNPINPSIVSSNYYFVCNVFNQLFGNAPTLLQNIALGTCEPIAIPDNTALLIKQTKALLSSQVDSLSLQVSIGDAVILSALASPCSATPITASTTITTSGFYCLANNSVTLIVVNASDVVVDLNNHVVIGAVTINASNDVTIGNGAVRSLSTTSDAITVNGTSNIKLSNVRAENGRRGMFMNGVQSGAVSNCEFTSNFTGIELVASADVTIEKSAARRNQYSGFSLASSFTNTIRDCTAMNSGQGNANQINNNVYGFVAFNSTNNIFENCIANATQALSTTDYNSIVAGFALTGTSNCNKIIGCEAANAITNASGVTVPYGIYLQGTLGSQYTLTAVPLVPAPEAQGVRAYASWSSDGQYFAVATGDTAAYLNVYSFNRTTEIFTRVAIPNILPTSAVLGIEWSPGDYYLAVGNTSTANDPLLRIYSFDRSNNSLQQVAVPDVAPTSGVQTVSWRYDQQFLAIGCVQSPRLIIYAFDPVALRLSQVVSNTAITVQINSVDWSPDGLYLAVGVNGAASNFLIFSFDSTTNSLTQVAAPSPVFGNTVDSVQWSHDGAYVAIGTASSAANRVQIYSFNRATNQLTLVATPTVTPNGAIISITWSPDDRYVFAGGNNSPHIYLYQFDRGANTLTRIATPDSGPNNNITSVTWSPDGRFITATTNLNDPLGTYVYSALSFPSDNMIKENTIYCNSGAQYPSGVGISGSSICNYIVGNTAYSNPINPLVVSSNYQFVCNVFNQLFGNAPSLLQNIALGSCEPIAIPDNTALLIKQTKALLSSQVDSLSLQVSIGDAVILSALASPCSATPITASTTITTSGFYCLANNSVTLIVVNASDVVVDLNNHVVIGAITVNATNDVTISSGAVRSLSTTSDAITVNGTSNIRLSKVRAENGQRGIYMNGVQSGAVSNCEFTSNFTGIELVASADVTIEESTARRNQYSGFSLASSFTNTIRDCTAMNSGQGNTNQTNNNVYGFVAFNSTNNIFENCIANATQALSTTDYNSIVAGFALTGTSNSNKIIGCEAANAITNASGVTVPYGIYLQGTLGSQYTLTAVPLIPAPEAQVPRAYASWSSDGQYFAVATGDTAARLNVYSFNRATEIFTRVAIPDILPTSSVLGIAWSPDGYFLAVGNAAPATDQKLRIYSFDRSNNSLQQVAVPDVAPTGGAQTVSWRYDRQFLAVGGGGMGSDSLLMIYAFDPVALQLSQVASDAAITVQVNSVAWSPDGLYLAVGTNASTSTFVILKFDSTTNSLTQVAVPSPVIGNSVISAQWSHDGAYVVIGTNLSGANRVQIYSFNRTTHQLTLVATPTINPPTSTIFSVTWSPDDRYVFAGGDTSPYIYLYQFDRGSNTLTRIATPNSGPNNNITSVTWSPDGRFITATTNLTDPLGTYVYSALSFPSDNMIKENTIYCNSGAQYPSGVGISGSSICNYIVGNTAYSNPINPLIVSSNYQFVCNVFNQLFGNTPSLLQNIALGSCESIAIPDNTALLIKQAQAQILSALVSPCAAIPIIANTTITTSGFYCLANNSVQNITINASDVVVDLNNHVVIGTVTVNATNDVTIGNGVVRSLSTTSDAITVNGTSNIKLSKVRAENGQRGIYMNGVQSGAVSNCECTSNFTGIELVASAGVTIEESTARGNQYSGFSLASSFTNTIRDCTAMNSGQGNTNELNNNVYGFVAFNSTNNIFENCIANATQALSTTDYNSIVAGFALTGTSNCNKIIGCEAANAITNASGVTVPYGIYLQNTFSGLISLTVAASGASNDEVNALSWSPDGQYLVVGLASYSHTNAVNLYRYNRTTNGLVLLQSINLSVAGGDQAFDLQWSPDGNYLGLAGDIGTGHTANGVIVYQFDRTIEQLAQVASVDPFGAGIYDKMLTFAWSPDGQYFAVGGNAASYAHSGVFVYGFNTITQSINLLTTIVPPGVAQDRIWTAQWSPDGNYLAFGCLNNGADNLFVYSFNRGAGTFAYVASEAASGGTEFDTLAWSPDGNYIAVGGDASSSGPLVVYRFNRGNSPGLAPMDKFVDISSVGSVDWSPDGRFLAVYGDGSSAVNLDVFTFDRGTQKLGLLQSLAFAPAIPNFIGRAAWSPDGRLLAVGNKGSSNVIIYQALSFPSDNVIKDNTVYCNSGAQYPSGVGISGSSICNMIIQNTAYSNPINPPIVSSNYYFVCNVFNQLFGNAPTLLQNIALGTCEPIAIPDNTALLIKQAQAQILSALVSPCAAIPIIANTTITTSGFYCLANNSVSLIVINASDVVVDLNNHVVTGAVIVNATNDVTIGNGVVRSLSTTSDAITVNGTSNIKLSKVRAENGQRGMFMNGVQSGAVSNCEFTSNFTGIELVASAGVTIEESTARGNQYSGFSLASSFTNTIRDCTAMNSGQGNTNQINNNVYGFVAFNSTNNIFENCIANATQALSTTDYNSIVAGFALTGTSNCNKIIGCEAANAITNANGVTVPYGIYLQNTFSGLISLTVAAPGGPGDPVTALDWSPDGQYLVVGIFYTNALNLYRYNRTTNGLVLLQSIELSAMGYDTVSGLQWSPDGNYLGVSGAIGTTNSNDGVIIYQFDRTIEQLAQVASVDPFGAGAYDDMYTFAWSPDGQYFAVGGKAVGFAHSNVFVYGFNTITQSINLLTTIVVPGGNDRIWAVQWSPDGNYLAFGGGIVSANDLFVYSFNRGTGTFAFVTSVPASGGTTYNFFETLAWSPDGNYLAVGGASITPGPFAVYRFNRGNSPSLVKMDTSTLISDVKSVVWSPDGRFLSVYGHGNGDTGGTLNVFIFDRGTQKLGLLQSLTLTSSSLLFFAGKVAWSPDGRLLAVGDQHFPNDFNLIIYQALSFPSDNVIKDNTVYCNSGAQYPSGVGISGSSICNMIIQNTAYSNPINPPIVSSNYYFVCNVFNQLFGNAPTLLQNIALGSCEPIAIPDNTALLQKQALARIGQITDTGTYLGSLSLPQSSIDNLQLDVIQLLKSILIKLYA